MSAIPSKAFARLRMFGETFLHAIRQKHFGRYRPINPSGNPVAFLAE
jgi:hypothetical protein